MRERKEIKSNVTKINEFRKLFRLPVEVPRLASVVWVCMCQCTVKKKNSAEMQ